MPMSGYIGPVLITFPPLPGKPLLSNLYDSMSIYWLDVARDVDASKRPCKTAQTLSRILVHISARLHPPLHRHRQKKLDTLRAAAV
jgi:hypothetical protein